MNHLQAWSWPQSRGRSIIRSLLFLSWLVSPGIAWLPATHAQPPARCEIIPGANQQFELRIDGVVRTAWNFSSASPRPFLYPLVGPSGQSVTRMGHPGAPDHDHHRSVWFAHHKLEGQDFWSELGGTTIRQKQWYALEDGDQAARMACQLIWTGKDEQALMLQDLSMEFRPLADDELAIEIQSTFFPADGRESVRLEQTNFGLLAVRVSKSISEVFGVGELTSDDGEIGEPQLFGKPHRWVDYSGASAVYPPVDSENQTAKWLDEGVTYFDHPSNPGFPNAWHVRADGWMCASPCFNNAITCTAAKPLKLRYLLHVHGGGYDKGVAESMFAEFSNSPAMIIKKSSRSHVRYEIQRQ